MRVPLSWLRDFVDEPVLPAELAADLTMLGLALDALDEHGDDYVLDIDVTANRPDCLSILGVAREVAARYQRPLREPVRASSAAGAVSSALVSVDLADSDLCPRYAARVVTVAPAVSPPWLRRRLELAGTRSVNAVVDVTNYVLYEVGQPLHAFDLDRLAERRLVVRRARAGERLTTLDGVDRALDPDMLVIADASRPQAIGGVMGGSLSEVSDRTRTIVLESAYFLPTSIRRTSRRLGLKTEASSRFERGANPAVQVEAIERACTLLEAIGAGTAHPETIDVYPIPRPATRIDLRLSRAHAVIGAPVEARFVEETLSRLGFELEARDDRSDPGRGTREWRVIVPPHRVDVVREIDLVEEIARTYGYGRIAATLPPARPGPVRVSADLRRDRLVRDVLTGGGCYEAQTLAFVEAAADTPFADSAGSVPIVNPLSEKFAVLRSSLLPGLVDAIAWNLNRQIADVRLFEIADSFRAAPAPTGTRALGLALCGAAPPSSWSAPARPVDLFDAKGLLEAVLERLGVRDVAAAPQAFPDLVDGRSAALTAGGAPIGRFGQLRPAIASARGVEVDTFVGELDLAAVYARGTEPVVEPLPRFPATTRDLAVAVDEHVAADAVRAGIRASAPSFLVDVRLFDRYTRVGAGRVSLAFRLTYRAADRTLTDAEVASAHEAIVAHLERAIGAVRR